MSEKMFEDEKAENFEYDYSTLDTYYELKDGRIIEWNKHSCNAEYFDFESIARILNIKEMRLESCQKNKVRVGQLYDENEQLKQSNDRFADTVAKQVSLIIELRKENEQLSEKRIEYWKTLFQELYNKTNKG